MWLKMRTGLVQVHNNVIWQPEGAACVLSQADYTQGKRVTQWPNAPPLNQEQSLYLNIDSYHW